MSELTQWERALAAMYKADARGDLSAEVAALTLKAALPILLEPSEAALGPAQFANQIGSEDIRTWMVYTAFAAHLAALRKEAEG